MKTVRAFLPLLAFLISIPAISVEAQPLMPEPLWIVDKYEVDALDFLNPNDIESISVFKDAASTATYGPRGSNGVVQVYLKYERDTLFRSTDAPRLIAEQLPRFRDGNIRTFSEWVQSEINYPETAIREDMDGNVVLAFVIERDGRIGDCKVLETPGEPLSAEALRILKSSPAWTPALHMGQPVPIKYNVTVQFRIPGKTYKEEIRIR